LSYPILNGILRDKLGFDGVVFSDDMQMHAITKHYGLEEAVKLAINAGIDIMTFSNNIHQSEERTVDRVHWIIKDQVNVGKIPRERIDESYRRIMTLKKKYLFDETERYAEDTQSGSETADKILGLEEQIRKLEAEVEALK